jgi:hypothetical protein
MVTHSTNFGIDLILILQHFTAHFLSSFEWQEQNEKLSKRLHEMLLRQRKKVLVCAL